MKKRFLQFLARRIESRMIKDGRPEATKIEAACLPLDSCAYATRFKATSWKSRLYLFLGGEVKVGFQVASIETLPPLRWRTGIVLLGK